MEWLSWSIAFVLSAVAALVAIVTVAVTVAVKVDWVAWCKYRDEKKEKQRMQEVRARCVHQFIPQPAGFAFCVKCRRFAHPESLRDQVRRGRIKMQG